MSGDTDYIVKKVLYAGTQSISVRDGTKVFFHFQTKLCNKDDIVIDDSRKLLKNKPFHLILGKQFKLEVWEALLQQMALNEVASFKVHKSLVSQYPFVSKTLRDLDKPDKHKNHMCAMSLQGEGLGYPDLNDLMSKPQDLEFIIEIVKVEQPDEYEKETWQMNEEEQIDLIPKLKTQGNDEYGKKNYQKASELYAKAIGEKPHDLEWNTLNEQKLPILLNFAQCKLNEKDYYSVITHCTEVLKYDKDNVKGYFRRAKAHIAAWNPKEAKEDLEKVMELDKSLIPLVRKELSKLEDLQRIKDLHDKEKLKKMFI